MRTGFQKVFSILFAMAAWEITVKIAGNPILINLWGLYAAFIKLIQEQQFYINALVSIRMLIFGFALSVIVGILLSVITYNIKILNRLLEPIINSFRNVAAVSLIPIFIVLLGTEKAKIATIFWTAWVSIYFNSLYGYSQIDADIISAGRMDGATDFQIFRFIRFPLALNAIKTGLTIGISGGWISLVTAEAIGSNAGLGYAIIQKTQIFKYAEAYIYILFVAVIGYISVKLISFIKEYET